MRSRLGTALPTAVSLTCLISACGDRGGASIGTVVQDSAGVSIAHLERLPDWDDPEYEWLTADVLELPPGPIDRPNYFDPYAAVLLASGDLLLLDRGPHRFLLYPQGAEVPSSQFGETGRGPGELWSPDGIWQRDDVLIVPDAGNNRVNRFTTDGAFIGEAMIPDDIGRPRSWGFALDSQQLFVHAYAFDTGENGLEYVDQVFRATDSDGYDAVFELPARAALPSGALPGTVTFFPQLLWTVLPSGLHVVGRMDQPVLDVWDSNGHKVSSIRLPLSVRPLRNDDRERIARERDEVLRGRRPPSQMSFHSDFRLFEAIRPVGDSLFALQLGRYSYGAEEKPILDGLKVWRIFSTAGRYRGAMIFPDEFRPWGVQDNMLLGVRRDSLDVSTVEIVEIAPPPN